MMPVLFRFGPFAIYTYGVFVALAFFVAASLLSQEAKRRSLDENLIYNLCILLLVAGIASARLFYVGLHWDEFKDRVVEIIMLQHGGLIWFGGLIGALAGGLIFLKLKKMPVLRTLDVLVPYAALAQAIGRIGCFFNGCCFGKPSVWGIYFPVHQAALFPSQLLDSLTLLIIFIILRLAGQRKNDGEIFSFYVVLASLQRFLLEFIRWDARPFYGPFSIFQWISIALFVSGSLFYLLMKPKWKKKSV